MRKTFFFQWIVLFLLSSCQYNQDLPKQENSSDITTISNTIMEMKYNVTIGKKLDHDQIHQVEEIIRKVFAEGNQIYNNWNPNSEVSQLNIMKAGETRKISAQMEQILLDSQKAFEVTNGLFDPTVAPLQKLWKSYLDKGLEPPAEKIKAIAPAVGWKNIHFKDRIFSKDHDETSLDLGGIAKGTIVDLLVKNLNQANFKDVFVEWSGEIRASGKHPEDRSWRVFISNLGDSDPENAVAQVDLDNQAIATSGDYHQYWIVKDPQIGHSIVYFHIINPKTLKPVISKAGSIASASVMANECWFADVLATAASIFESVEEGEAWAKNIQKEFPELEFWLLSRESDFE